MRLPKRYGAPCLALLLGLTLITAVPAVTAAAATAATAPPSAPAAQPPTTAPPSVTAPTDDLAPHAAAGVLMDATTGQVLWEKNAHAKRAVASITKLMTMAVVLDAIQSGRIRWTDVVSTGEDAWQTKGAQIWLEIGELMSVRQLFTAVAVASANDAAVALADYVGGGTAGFVERMNRLAASLGMRDTRYTNPHGLDEEGHLSSAYDVALISRFLVTRRPDVLRFTSTYDTYLRQNLPGKKPLWLVNTNRVCLRTFAGCDGLKTGWTSQAGYGVSMTAKRGDTRLIAVVLGEPTADLRNNEAFGMLNYGFLNYATAVVAPGGQVLAQVPVDLGQLSRVGVGVTTTAALTVQQGQAKGIGRRLELPGRLRAPLASGQRVGTLVATRNGQRVAAYDLVALTAVPRVGVLRLFLRMLRAAWTWV